MKKCLEHFQTDESFKKMIPLGPLHCSDELEAMLMGTWTVWQCSVCRKYFRIHLMPIKYYDYRDTLVKELTSEFMKKLGLEKDKLQKSVLGENWFKEMKK